MWEKLFNKMQRSDFTLVFNGHPVECHKVVLVDLFVFLISISILFLFFFISMYKVVLSAASPVFEAMVENEHKEGIEGKHNISLYHVI